MPLPEPDYQTGLVAEWADANVAARRVQPAVYDGDQWILVSDTQRLNRTLIASLLARDGQHAQLLAAALWACGERLDGVAAQLPDSVAVPWLCGEGE